MDFDVLLEEYRRLLRHKAQQYDLYNAESIIDWIVAHKPLEDIRWYSLFTSDQQTRPLFDEAISDMLHLQFLQSQPQLHPTNSSQIFQFQPPLPWAHWKLHFDPSGNFGNHAPFPGSTGSFGGNQAPSHLLHQEPRFYPSSTLYGHQAPFRPTGPSGGFPGDGMQSNNRNAHHSVTGYPLRSSNAQNKPCKYYFDRGGCMKGSNCPFPHVSSGFPHMKKKPVHTLKTLRALDFEIELLCLQERRRIPIECLPQKFYGKYGKSLLVEGFKPEGLEQGKRSYSLRCLLIHLKTIKVIESNGEHYVVLVIDDSGGDKAADDSKLALAPPSCGSSKIFIYFYYSGVLSAEDVKNYFRNSTSAKLWFCELRVPRDCKIDLIRKQ